MKPNTKEKIDFLDDKEKMIDFLCLSKEEFLLSYSYLTEDEYSATLKAYEDETEQTADIFYNWLIEMNYCEADEKLEDIKDVENDFKTIRKTAPKLFNLLKCISQ